MSQQMDSLSIFLDVYSGLPRQGPGSDTTTRRALALVKEQLPPSPTILDVGSGSGMQTQVLASELKEQVIAVDYFHQYISRVKTEIDTVHPMLCVQGDMNHLPLASGLFDLIWAEGSIYIMGIEEALTAWKRLLNADGFIGFSQLTWLTDEHHPDSLAFWQREYPQMPTIDTINQIITDTGYRVVDHFTIPDRDWWVNYYDPLAAKLPAMREKYAGVDVAQDIINQTEEEISIRKRFGHEYGYEFFVVNLSQ